MDRTSASLLERLQTGADQPAWQRLVEVYTPLIRHWLRQREVLINDCDDITQEVLQVVVGRLPEFEHNGRVGAFRTWLRAIAANCLRDFLRAKRNKPQAVGGSDVQQVIAELADPQSELSRLWDQEHDRLVTRRLLELLQDQFEPQTWRAFEQVVLAGRPASEVAAELGITTNAVFIAKSRILARLRQEAAGLVEEIER